MVSRTTRGPIEQHLVDICKDFNISLDTIQVFEQNEVPCFYKDGRVIHKSPQEVQTAPSQLAFVQSTSKHHTGLTLTAFRWQRRHLCMHSTVASVTRTRWHSLLPRLLRRQHPLSRGRSNIRWLCCDKGRRLCGKGPINASQLDEIQ